jgi:hypothetical protein
MKSGNIVDLKFNPIEDRVMVDRAPAVWNGPHVGKRIAEAFATLAAMPVAGLSRKTGLWPAYPYEFEDILAQQEAEERAPRPGRRPAVSIEQISRMDTALCWPAHYLAKDPAVMRCVNGLARERARGGDSTSAARRWHRFVADARVLQRMHDDGCDTIARGLIRDRVRVF